MMFRWISKMVPLSYIALCVAFFLAANRPAAMEETPEMDFKPRIVGGKRVNIATYPYVVSVQVRSSHACGGSIVTSLYILTAAHCFYNPSTLQLWSPNTLKVLAGTTVSDSSFNVKMMQIKESMQLRTVVKMLPAPDHVALSEGGSGPDVGLLKLDNALRWSRWVRPAPLPPADVNDTLGPSAGTVCQTMGWGHSKPMPTAKQKEEGAPEPPLYPSLILNMVELPIIPFNKCLEYYEVVTPVQHLCTLAEGKDACNGDSGGPMICDGQQMAIVMAGDGCAQPNSPGAFSRLIPHLPWVRSITNYEEEIAALTGDFPEEPIPEINERKFEKKLERSSASLVSPLFNVFLISATNQFLLHLIISSRSEDLRDVSMSMTL